MGRFSRALKHMFNAFSSEAIATQAQSAAFASYGASYGVSSRPHTVRVRVSNEKSIVSSIYARLAVDVGSAEFRHVRVDDTGKWTSDMQTGLNDCLTVEANIDQTPDAFLRDYAFTLFDKGVAAIVPVDTTADPSVTGSWDMGSMRVGEVLDWAPRHVKVRVYNDQPDKGIREDLWLPKNMVGIVENPFYTVMNEPNSTLQRLIHKLNLLDGIDDAAASGKMDMIIQLPYVIKSDAKRQQAEQRRADITAQLRDSEYGIAYTDGTEKITQLNRPVTNNLLEQITYLQGVVYDQLGLTAAILNGTADEKTMLNYTVRTIKPFLDALKQEMIRKFLTKTARTQGQTIMFFKNPFELIPLSQMAEIGDVLSRNEIVSPNEFRQAIGLRPSADPAADKLQNSNMVAGTTPGTMGDVTTPQDPQALPPGSSSSSSGADGTNAALDQVNKAIDDAFSEFGVPDDEQTG